MARRNTPAKYDKDPCVKCTARGQDRSVYKAGYDNCWRHLPKSQRDLIRQEQRLAKLETQGLYDGSLSDSLRLLQLKAQQSNKIGQLTDVNITAELALSRLLLSDWLDKHKDDTQIPVKDLTDILKTIAQIAKLSQSIGQADEKALSDEVMRAIINSISHAFHKANLLQTPEERAVAFATEIASIFGGAPDPKHPPALPSGDHDRPIDVDGEVQTL